jgi:protein phosphatase
MRLGESAGRTHPGKVRRRNEDSYVLDPPLFAVADGMGGAQAGEVASRLTAAAFREYHEADALPPDERVQAIIQEANRRIYERAHADSGFSGMGTTVTAALLLGGRVTIGHVGDSRAYRIRDGELEQLTDDHSLVGDLMRSGRLTPEEADAHPQRSVITRALGTEPEVDVDTFTIETEPDDVYLICSDGLTDMVSPGEIQALLIEHAGDLDAAAHALVAAANAGGGEDNITVVLFQIAGAQASEVTVKRAVVAPEPETEADDDDDTLSGLDAVPTVDTAVIPPAEVEEHLQRVEAEPAVPAKPRRRLTPLILLVLLLTAIAVLAAWGLTR